MTQGKIDDLTELRDQLLGAIAMYETDAERELSAGITGLTTQEELAHLRERLRDTLAQIAAWEAHNAS